MAYSREEKNARNRIYYHNKKYGTSYNYRQFMHYDIDPSKIKFKKGETEYRYDDIERTKLFDEGVIDVFLTHINELRDYWSNSSVQYATRIIEDLLHNHGTQPVAYALGKYRRAEGLPDYGVFYDGSRGISSNTSEMITQIFDNLEDYYINEYRNENQDFISQIDELDNLREMNEDMDRMFDYIWE